MNQMVFNLCNETIQYYAQRDLKLNRLQIIICPYLVKFTKHNELKRAFLPEIIILPQLFLSEIPYVISSFNLRTEPSTSKFLLLLRN